jgi:transposase
MRLVRMRTMGKNGRHAMALTYRLAAGRALFTRRGRAPWQALPLPPHLSRRRDERPELLTWLDEHLDPLDGQIAAADDQARPLMTHPGVGPLTALATVLGLSPVTRFPTSQHVVSYLGLAPAVAAAAATCRLGHITKQGNTLLGYVLGQAGLGAARSTPDLRRLYGAVMYRHGRAKAKVAVARKLLIRLYIMRRDQIDYAEFRDRGRWPRAHPARRGHRASLTSGAMSPRGLRSRRHEVQWGRSRAVRGRGWDRVLPLPAAAIVAQCDFHEVSRAGGPL